MFTGIITDIGCVRSVDHRGDLRVVIGTGYDTAGLAIGASVACSGPCLTVVDKGVDADGGWFAVDVSAESVSRIAADHFAPGRRLNLERALRVGDELGGHIVSGHVDGVGAVAAVAADGASTRLTIVAASELAPFIAPKGSIAVDGVSLTVNAVEDLPDGRVSFGLNIIPHTAAWTTLGDLRAGDAVNLEIDTLARYLRRMEAVTHGK